MGIQLDQCRKISVEPIRRIKDVEAIRRMLKDKPRELLLFTLGINNGLRACDLLRLKVGEVRHLKPGGTIQIKESKPANLMSSRSIKSPIAFYRIT